MNKQRYYYYNYSESPKEAMKCSISTTKTRSSRSLMLYKMGVLQNFAKFSRKHLSWRTAILSKMTPVQVFFCEFYEILRTSFLQMIYGRLFNVSNSDARNRQHCLRFSAFIFNFDNTEWFDSAFLCLAW